jgi:hypothetical protein
LKLNDKQFSISIMHAFCIHFLRHAARKNPADGNIRLVAKAGGGYNLLSRLRVLVLGR